MHRTLSWLSPFRCRLLLVLVLVLNFLLHLYLLHKPGWLDLAGDEAQYWDWSRQLDLSYYSKGPAIAYIIRASCSIFGQTMPAIRYPAIVFATITGGCFYWLSRKLFQSDRLALGTVLLSGLVPMFAAGSSLMTIDSPFFLLWALATCLAAKAIFDDASALWPIIGLLVGIGFLTKYAMLLWLPAMLLFLLVDPASRKHLRLSRFWLATLIALLCTLPVVIWNAQHDWVTLRHVGTQTGASGESHFQPTTILLFLVGQAGIINPAVFACVIAGTIFALRVGFTKSSEPATVAKSVDSAGSFRRVEPVRQLRFLVVIGLFFFLVTSLSALRSKPQPNWPAPAYFTLLILASYFLSRELSVSKIWRTTLAIAIGLGIVMLPTVYDTTLLYPLVRWINAQSWSFKIKPARVDFAYKLRGNDQIGEYVGSYLKPGDMVFCEDYQMTSLMAFYVPGQPRTFYTGSWTGRRRWAQYDLWPDRQLDRPALFGKDALVVGDADAVLRSRFEHWQELPELPIERDGLLLRTVRLARGVSFKGMSRPAMAPAF